MSVEKAVSGYVDTRANLALERSSIEHADAKGKSSKSSASGHPSSKAKSSTPPSKS
jgi:hypothetical protein